MARIVTHWESRGGHDYCGDDEGRVYQWHAMHGWVEVRGRVQPTAECLVAPTVADEPEQVGAWYLDGVWGCRCRDGLSHQATQSHCHACGAARPIFAVSEPF